VYHALPARHTSTVVMASSATIVIENPHPEFDDVVILFAYVDEELRCVIENKGLFRCGDRVIICLGPGKFNNECPFEDWRGMEVFEAQVFGDYESQGVLLPLSVLPGLPPAEDDVDVTERVGYEPHVVDHPDDRQRTEMFMTEHKDETMTVTALPSCRRADTTAFVLSSQVTPATGDVLDYALARGWTEMWGRKSSTSTFIEGAFDDEDLLVSPQNLVDPENEEYPYFIPWLLRKPGVLPAAEACYDGLQEMLRRRGFNSELWELRVTTEDGDVLELEF
jgi:hypothetical protein